MVSAKTIEDTQILEIIRTNTEDMSLDFDSLNNLLYLDREEDQNDFLEKKESLYEVIFYI